MSGGEALLQIDFLLELFEKAQRRGINTCLDTSAQLFTRQGTFFEKFERLMEVTEESILKMIEKVNQFGFAMYSSLVLQIKMSIWSS